MKYAGPFEELFTKLHELRVQRRHLASELTTPTYDSINLDHQIEHMASSIAALARASRGLL